MRHLKSLAWLLAACALAAGAQGARPDFSGTWELDRAKSDFGPLASSPAARAEVTLVVAHAGAELKLTRRERRDGREQTVELAYYTDGRGEVNPSTLGRVGLKSATKWDGERVVSTSTLARRGADGKTSTLETVERWQLSRDGRTLTQTTSTSYGGGTQTIRQVYRRATR